MKRLILATLVLAAACGSGKHDPTGTASTAFRLTQLVDAVAGVEVTFKVAALDASGAVNATYRGTVQLATDDTRSTGPSEVSFQPTDAGQITAKVVFKTAGARTFVVVDKTNPSALGLVHVLVSPGAAARITLEGLPAQVAADAMQSLTVTVRDAFDNPVSDYAGTIRFASSDAQAPSIPDTTFGPADRGVKMVTAQFGTAGTQSLFASDIATPSIAGSASTQVTHGPAAFLVLAGIPPATLSGAPLTVTVTAVDNHGNLAADFTGTVHFASTDPKAALPADYAFTAADLGSHTFAVVLTSAGTSTVVVTSASLPAVLANVAVHEAGAAQVKLEGLPAQVTADAIQNITVRVRDALGNAVTDYAGTLRFANTDREASPIPDLAFLPADLGTKVVTVQFGTAGTQTLSASDTLIPSISGAATTQVLHGPPGRLVLTGIPPSTVAGSTLTANVTAVDTHGNVATDFTGRVHFTSTDPTAALVADVVFTAADLGSSTFPVAFTRAGASSLTATSAGLPPATANTVVRAAAASQVTLEGLPAQVVVDVSQNVTVTVRDAFANPATDYAGTLRFTNSDAQAPSVADTTFVPADAGGKVVAVQFATAGPQSLSARDTVTPSIVGSALVQVLHGPAAGLVIAGMPSSTVAGTLLAATVTAVDRRRNPVTDFSGTVHFASTDPNAQLPADFTFTAANLGSRTFPVTLTKAGRSTLTVSSSGLPPGTADVEVRHAGAVQVTLEGLPALVVVDVPQNVTATVRDAFGNAVTDYAGTLRFTNSDPQAPSIADTTFGAADLGVKVVVVQFGTAGAQSLSASDTVTASIAGSASTQVVHGPAARLVLTGIPPSTVAGTLLTGAVTAVDNHGNVVTDFTGTVHFSSTDPKAQLQVDAAFSATDKGVKSFSVVLTTAGAWSVSVSQVGGSAAGATANVAVANAPASRITLDAHAAQVPVDTNAVFTVTLRDRFGNPALDYTGTVHFVPSDRAATTINDLTFTPAMFATADVTVQFGTVGEQSLLAFDTLNAAISGSAIVKVTNGPAATYGLSALPTTAIAGEPLSLSITAVDAHGNPVLNYAGSAAVTSTDPSDRLPAPGAFVNGARNVSLAFVTSGLHRATVSEVGGLIHVDTSEVTIVSGDAGTLVVASSSTTAGAVAPATVLAKDAFGNVVASYRATVTLTSTDPQAILPAPYTFAALDAGQHTFSVTLKTAGTWSVIATDGVISGTAAFGVAPAAATNCDLTVIGKAGAEVAFRVKVMDAFTNLATRYTGTMTFDSSDVQAQLPAPATYAASDRGSRDFTAVLPNPGDQTIRATDAAASFSCRGSISIVIAQFFAVTFDGPEAWAGTARSATVQAQNATGAPITDYKGTIVLSSSDPAASVPASVTLTGTEGGHATVDVTFNTIGLQTFTAKDSADANKTGTAFQLVHGLTYTDPATGGKVRLVLNGAAASASVVQLDLVSNTSLFALGVADPQNSARVLPSSVRNGAFAAGMNLPLDSAKVGPDRQLLVLPPPASAILNLGASPQVVGAAFANGVLYSGVSQKRFDLTMTCTPPCTNDHLRGDVQARPFPGANSLYYSLRLRLTPGAAPGTVFDGQALAANARFRAAVRDRSGSEVFSGTADFAVGKLEVK